MYKISFFFKYAIYKNNCVFYICENSFSLKLDIWEKEKLEKFFYNFLTKNFDENTFYEVCDFFRKETFWRFFTKTGIFILENDLNFTETLLLVSLLINPSPLYKNLNSKNIQQIYKKRFFQKENKKIIKNNWIILDLLKNRKTYRKYKKSDLNLEEIKYLCQCSYWNIYVENKLWNEIIHKTTPSWWWFFPCKIVFFAFGQDFIDKYIFDGIDLIFQEHIWDKQQFLQDVFIYNPELDFINSSWFLVVLADLRFISQKYWAKSYSLVLLEWWHISQNFIFASLEKWYWTCEIGWVFEKNLLSYCNVWKYNIFINSILFWKI